MTVSRHGHEVGVDAAPAEGAEELDAVGRAEREHAADVGDVAEAFAAVEIHELDAAAPFALGQRVSEWHEPNSGVANNCVAGGPAILREHRNGTQQAQG